MPLALPGKCTSECQPNVLCLDHLRISSTAGVNSTSIDDTDNDGIDLGGTDYRTPSVEGLSLYVVTGADQTAT